MSTVAVVTDSTAGLAPGEGGVAVVPLQVVVDGVSGPDGSVGGAEIAEAMRRRRPVSTSQPTPHRILAEYERLAADGVEEIVSIHLSSGLSGTVDAARSAAVDSPVPVRVVDSGLIAAPLGGAALAAAARAADGGSADEVEAAAKGACEGAGVLLYVDTLEHLRRGGRIGGAQALLGSALAIKPILELRDGVVQPLERVRTASKALARLEALCVERAQALRDGGREVRVAVHHLDAQERAEGLADRLAEHGGERPEVVELGAVIGAHVGPGTIALTLSPSP
jgi:DegV family protein with EDD domain